MTFFTHKVQNLLPLILLLFLTGLEAQQRSDITSKETTSQVTAPLSTQDAAQLLQTDFNIDVQFYHISIDIDIENETIDGSVVVDFKPLINNLNQIKLNLRNVFTVTNITMDGAPVTWSHSNHILNVNLNQTYSIGDEPSVKIYYNGAPERVQSGGVTKGFRFDTHGNNVPAIVNLSTPYLSHYWFPCKDGPTDKADNGIRLDITVPNTTYGDRKLKAVSNGMLINEVVNNGKRTYTWQHNHAIAPYYILVAVSNYQTIERTYNNNGHNFPIKYYTFPANSNQATSIANMFNQAFDAYIHYFGDYPYRDEGYAMTEIVPFWYIEKQTNSVVANWNWTILMPHELAHMWFGNSITNQTWQHIWLNEGFATYAEALYYEYTSGMGAYHNHMRSMGARHIWDRVLFNEDDSRHWEIFDYFYYEKGAWLLHMLRGYIGDDEIFFDLIKAYAQDPQFKHGYVTTDEFRQYVEAFTGLDLYNFFDQWVYDMSFADYEYNFYSDLAQGKAGLTINQSQSEGTSNEREVFEMNLDLRIEFADGSSRKERVYNNQKLQHFYFDIDKEVIDIIIDPDEWVIRFDVVFNSSLPVPPAPIAENRILSFSVEEQIGEAQINHTTGTIQFAVSDNENINALTPQIEVSPGAIVSPASGATQDFSSPIVYTVTGSDNSVKEYTVTVVTLSGDSQITSFTIEDQIGETVIDNGNISITMPFGTDLTSLTPV
ncbi:M1 family metallopeptidase, partial [Alkalitalea saponilacus]